jgi:hypothetical protein
VALPALQILAIGGNGGLGGLFWVVEGGGGEGGLPPCVVGHATEVETTDQVTAPVMLQ